MVAEEGKGFTEGTARLGVGRIAPKEGGEFFARMWIGMEDEVLGGIRSFRR